jgi:hypothetical protein
MTQLEDLDLPFFPYWAFIQDGAEQKEPGTHPDDCSNGFAKLFHQGTAIRHNWFKEG